MKILVKYITTNPNPIPSMIDVLERVFSFSSRIYWIIDTTTWKIAPAPIDKNTTVAKGE